MFQGLWISFMEVTDIFRLSNKMEVRGKEQAPSLNPLVSPHGLQERHRRHKQILYRNTEILFGQNGFFFDRSMRFDRNHSVQCFVSAILADERPKQPKQPKPISLHEAQFLKIVSSSLGVESIEWPP